MALPEFDTYNSLIEYARNPKSAAAHIGFAMLKMRAVARLQWDIGTIMCRSHMPFELARDLRMGMKPSNSGSGDNIRAVMRMTDEEKLAYYTKCCKLAGFDIDSCTSLEQGKETQNTQDSTDG